MANLSKVKVTNIEGQIEVIDMSKTIGNILYTQGKDVDICECGKKIYYGESVELSAEQKEFIMASIANMPYILRSAIEQELKQ